MKKPKRAARNAEGLVARIGRQAKETLTTVTTHVAGAYILTGAAVLGIGGAASGVVTSAVAIAKGFEVSSNRTLQVSAAAAVGGAAAGGAGGAATGLVAGGAVGATIGLVPAFFTFGLSIPVFAAIGSGCGTVLGAVGGGSAGLVCGGAAGYGAYSQREAISSGANFMKKTASESAGYVCSRLVGGTGGTSE